MLKTYEGAHKQSAIIEKEIRRKLKKSVGKLTEADLKKVKDLHFAPSNNIEISDAGLKGLTKLAQLKGLRVQQTKVTKVGVAELQKALPNCVIIHDAKK